MDATARMETLEKELATAKTQLKEALEKTRKDREAAARAEVTAFVSRLKGANDLRFGKEALDAFEAAYLDAKISAISEIPEVAQLAAKMVAHFETLAAKQLPVAPGGEKKPAPVPDASGAQTLSKADFASAKRGDHEAAERVHAHVMGLAGADPKKTYAQHLAAAEAAAK